MKHNFVESSRHFGEFHRVIYCTWCGLVVWNWNANDRTKPSLTDLQANTGKPCVDYVVFGVDDGTA